jgi:hypothetical protein
VAILAASLPPGSAVEAKLLTDCLLPYLDMRGTLGNLHKARAREAVLGALSRGLQVRLGDGSRREVDIDTPKLLIQLLLECGTLTFFRNVFTIDRCAVCCMSMRDLLNTCCTDKGYACSVLRSSHSWLYGHEGCCHARPFPNPSPACVQIAKPSCDASCRVFWKMATLH